MNFVKGLLGFNKEEKKDPNNFLKFVGEAKLYLIQKGEKKCVYNFPAKNNIIDSFFQAFLSCRAKMTLLKDSFI